jgi:hypothetical protein
VRVNATGEIAAAQSCGSRGFVDVLKLIRSGGRIQAGIHELPDVIQPRFRGRIGGSRRYCFGAYCISPLPKDQFLSRDRS